MDNLMMLLRRVVLADTYYTWYNGIIDTLGRRL